jgi:hypothetical protein
VTACSRSTQFASNCADRHRPFVNVSVRKMPPLRMEVTMIARFAIFILASVVLPAAAAASVDCVKNPTFLRKIPGGHEAVFHCECEPPATAQNPVVIACGHPSEPPRPSSFSTVSGEGTPRVPIAFPVSHPVRLAPAMRGLGAGPTHARPCVGLCYGMTSRVNGRARNSYVRGHYRANGTYVAPYTRSTRSRSTSRSGRRR